VLFISSPPIVEITADMRKAHARIVRQSNPPEIFVFHWRCQTHLAANVLVISLIVTKYTRIIAQKENNRLEEILSFF
jgi:hypothetical protein